jgi:polyisoprenoid-binding protein YceI
MVSCKINKEVFMLGFISKMLLVSAFIGTSAVAAKYTIDTKHSSVEFKIAHLVVGSVKGRFDTFEGTFDFDPTTGKVASLEAKVDVDSINTKEADRDKHLKAEDFFGYVKKDGTKVEKNHFMIFKMTSVNMDGNKPNKIIGDLTINGITKSITLDLNYKGEMADPWGGQRVAFEATSKFPRKDFGMTWNKAMDKGGFVVGEQVEVSIDGEAVKNVEKKVESKK